MTTEVLIKFLNKEVPYSINVKTQFWRENIKKIKIYQTIFLKRKKCRKVVVQLNNRIIKKTNIVMKENIKKLTKKRNVFLYLNIKTDQ